jgi:hypothetical protein
LVGCGCIAVLQEQKENKYLSNAIRRVKARFGPTIDYAFSRSGWLGV